MPNYYNPYYYPATQQMGIPQQQIVPAPQMQMAQTQPQVQIQNGGFVSVRNEEEARNYPIEPGKSVTFKDETAPYVYTKTMGFSQLDRPIFEKFKLVKEEPIRPETHQNDQNGTLDNDPINSIINELKGEIEAIWNEIEGIKSHPVSANKKTVAKRKEEDDE